MNTSFAGNQVGSFVSLDIINSYPIGDLAQLGHQTYTISALGYVVFFSRFSMYSVLSSLIVSMQVFYHEKQKTPRNLKDYSWG
jgi:hypothetical protein